MEFILLGCPRRLHAREQTRMTAQAKGAEHSGGGLAHRYGGFQRPAGWPPFAAVRDDVDVVLGNGSSCKVAN